MSYKINRRFLDNSRNFRDTAYDAAAREDFLTPVRRKMSKKDEGRWGVLILSASFVIAALAAATLDGLNAVPPITETLVNTIDWMVHLFV